MPFTKLPLTPGGSLVADFPPTRFTSSHKVQLAITDPVKLAFSHSSTASVKLAVEYLSQPYPPLEIQCHPQYRPFTMIDAR